MVRKMQGALIPAQKDNIKTMIARHTADVEKGRLDSVTLEEFVKAANECKTGAEYKALLEMDAKIEERIKAVTS